MRKLSNKELYDGVYVQCGPHPETVYPTVYQIIIREYKYFYKEINSDWEIPGDLVKDIWMETEETKILNRDNKINSILND